MVNSPPQARKFVELKLLYRRKCIDFARRRRENFADFGVIYSKIMYFSSPQATIFWSDFHEISQSGSYPPLCFRFRRGKGGDKYLDMA